jgi:DNA-binding MarR family transcriptional regulator
VTVTDQASLLVTQCTQALNDLADQTLPVRAWTELDLTMVQLKAIFVLQREGSLSVGHLARILAISEPAASMLVDRLHDAELAERERDPRDKRKTRVVPTAKAGELAECLVRVKEERLARWLGHMSDTDLRALLQGTRALVAAVSAVSPET